MALIEGIDRTGRKSRSGCPTSLFWRHARGHCLVVFIRCTLLAPPLDRAQQEAGRHEMRAPPAKRASNGGALSRSTVERNGTDYVLKAADSLGLA